MATKKYAHVLENDNSMSVNSINSGRSKYPPMMTALKTLDDVHQTHKARFIMGHIPTEENTIADCFTRGKLDEAEQHTNEFAVVRNMLPF